MITPEDEDKIEEIIARKLDIMSAFRDLPESDREAIAADIAPFLYSRQEALRKPENTYTPRITVSGNDINLNAAGDGLGHTGPTLPRWIDFVNATGYLDADAQMVHVQTAGGGADCMFDYLVSTCWATEVAAGRGTEGQTMTTLSGCTFKIYSTIGGALTDINTGTFTNPATLTVFVCKGTYTESVNWPDQVSQSNVVSVQIIGACSMGTQSDVSGVIWKGSGSSPAITTVTNPIAAVFRNIGIYLNAGNTAITRTTGSSWNCVFDEVSFKGTVSADFGGTLFNQCVFSGASFSTGGLVFGTSTAPTNVSLVNCIFSQCGIDLSEVTSFEELIVDACQFIGADARIQLADVYGWSITNCTFEGGATDRIAFQGSAGAGSGTSSGRCAYGVIASNNFTYGGASGGNAVIRFTSAQYEASHIIIANNQFQGVYAGAQTAGTCYIKLTGDSSEQMRSFCIAGNDFGGYVNSDGGYLEDSGVDYSIIGDYVMRSVFGPNTPANKVKYSITNGTNNEFYPPSSAVGTGSGSVSTAWPIAQAPAAKTIATGAITVTADQYTYTIETEAAAASDDLDTISGLVADRLYLFKPVNTARTVVFKHNTGNIQCIGNADITCDDIQDYVLVWYDGTTVMAMGSGSGAAPVGADYLVGTANGTLTNEIVVGTTPGGELGGTWASPTVDATHAGSAHHDAVTAGSGIDVAGQVVSLGNLTANWTQAGVFDISHAGNLLVLKHAALGSGAGGIDASSILYTQEQFSNPGADIYGWQGQLIKALTGANANGAFGGSLNLSVSGAFADTGIIAGFSSVLTRSTSGGTSSDFRNFWAQAVVAAGATITNRYGLYVSNGLGAGTLTNQYGLYLENMAKGGTLNRAIYSAGGLSVHAGAFRIGSVTAPTNTTAGDITGTRLIVPDAAILHSAISQLGGPVVIPAQGAVRFSDTDNSHYTGLKAHGTTTASVEYTLPPADGTSGYQLTTDGAGVLSWAAAGGSANGLIRAIEVGFDGGGSAITTGVKYERIIPFACTINEVTLLADQAGSIVIDIWKDTYANYPPTVADTITAAAKPTLSTAIKSQDTTLTGWTTAIAAGDTLRFNVDSASTVTRVTLSLKVTVT